jgi:Ran GTPase-activating protein (RanGAP) involved in mRNA processing and transport
MKKEGLGFCGYMKSLMTMGAGLPLKAITSDRIGDRLDYSDQELLPAQVRSLAAAIGNNKSLRTVQLHSCNIDDEGARHLATMLEKNTSLEGLDLRFNQITDDGLKHLAIPLEKNTSLEKLWLYHNNITDRNLKMKIKDIWNKTKGREGGLHFYSY